MENKKGLLLLNLGTPDNPTRGAVRKYLKEFLMDPQIVDLPYVFRWILVNGFISTFRARKKSLSYQKIWMEGGSPLLVHTVMLADKAQKQLGENWSVRVGMRYGNPSIKSALEVFKREGIADISVFPLYPQYAHATTGSCLEEVNKIMSMTAADEAKPRVIQPFYCAELFVGALAAAVAGVMAANDHDFVLFSFHGLPVRSGGSRDYQAQCGETARLAAARLGLAPERYAVAFQSRFGFGEWLKPYTFDMLADLAIQGIKRIVVVCPSFVCDCLETLEEIGIRGRDLFIKAGGERLLLAPSLNSSDRWTDALVRLTREAQCG
ncbi:MAG: ferrochelatase [Bdellovibrionota bacterium]